jgi:hypothetical protein
MSDQNVRNKWELVGSWFGNVANLAVIFAFAIIIYNFIEWKDKLIMLMGFGTLILMVFLRYADVSRFKETIPTDEAVPPLGIARGSVRAILALSILLGFGMYIYYATKAGNAINQASFDKIFTALLSILSAVTGFYFGSRGTTTPSAIKPPSPTISAVEPGTGIAGETVRINVSGTGFQPGASVSLNKGDKKIPAQEVTVVQGNKITCFVNIIPDVVGKWDVVVMNPDQQTVTLPGGFVITKKQAGG